jgi:arylsulfatase A-like enzyme
VNRRLLAVLATLAALQVHAGCREPQPSTDSPDRIVLIVADTLRRDSISPYRDSLADGGDGRRVETPNLLRLAREGLVFTNAHSSFHQTTMSMSALFTGRTPSLETGSASTSLPWTSQAWCGLARLASSPDDSCVPDALDTLAEDLRGAGFETLGVVANRLLFRPHGYDQGFDHWIEVGEREPPKDRRSRREESKLRTGARVNERVFETLAERSSDRFFLYVHYIDPHDYGIRPDLPRYADGVRYLDEAVGELLDGLEDEGLLAGATVVFTSDHGEYLGAKHALPANSKHFGNPSFESLLRVPLIVSPAPPGDPTRLVRSQDLRGLIQQLAGIPAAPDEDIHPDEIFLTEQFYQTYRRAGWKSTWARDGSQSALFHLESDPGETRNVADEHPEVVRQHRARVDELTRTLGTRLGIDAELSADDAERLRALGYLEEDLPEAREGEAAKRDAPEEKGSPSGASP